MSAFGSTVDLSVIAQHGFQSERNHIDISSRKENSNQLYCLITKRNSCVCVYLHICLYVRLLQSKLKGFIKNNDS